MKKRILILTLVLALTLPLFAALPAGAADDPSRFKTENVEVPEGWLYYEIDDDDDFAEITEIQRKDNSHQPMFIRLTNDIYMKSIWVSRFAHACLHIELFTTTVFDLNGHKIECDIFADLNGDNHTWIGLNVILHYGLVKDQYFRIVDSVGGGKVGLTATTDVDGPTTALVIQSYPVKLPQWGDEPVYGPYYSQGVNVVIDGGRFYLDSENVKFCLVQSGPQLDSNNIPRWGGWAPYARSAVALSGVKATINNGKFHAIYPTDLNGVADDMGRRFMSDLGLVDSYSASYLRINGGVFDGTCYSVYTYYNMSIYADDEKLMRKLDPMPVINGGEFRGGIQFCSTRTSFWRKLRGAYDLNPKMKDVKVSEVLFPGAKMYMDGKLIDPNAKDLEDIAWPHDVKVEPGPDILETRLIDEVLPVNDYTRFLVHYNKTPDSARLEEYITVIRLGQEQSYWTEAEGSYYTLQNTLGENWYNYYVPKKTSAATGKFRAVAEFEGKRVYSDEIEVEWIDVSDLGFTYGPVVHDGNGEGVACVDFDVSRHDQVKKVSLSWLDHGEYWTTVPDAPRLTPDYNNGLYRFYIPELADKNSDSTEYHITVEYDLGGLITSRDSESFVITEEILGAPMDPYDVGLDCIECLLDVGESKTIEVTLFPTATPHKTGFTVESSDPSVVQLVGQGEDYFAIRANNEGEATVTVTAVGGASETCEVKVFAGSNNQASNPFVDVKEGEYYYDPVLWAVNHDPQITKGTDETHFSPDATCTRGQIVTFLWRAVGCPEPLAEENPFDDVSENDYYYKAVLWAVENGITAGTDPGRFSPDSGCTRAQVVTFLWRAEGKPAPSASANPFVDVVSGEYYYDAVLWAVDKDITKGTDATHFSPNATCTRGQIVTFLYRDLA